MARILITSALPYINDIKHLGTLVGSMLPSDVYARFERSRGNEVLLICATDEHGTPAELAAAAAGKDVATFCDDMYDIQSDLGQRFQLSWDFFGRTSRAPTHELTQHLADRLSENELIDERTISQVFSIDDDRYLPDRYIVGTCPHCGYENARGDQCENCTRVLDPTDLVDPRSAVSGSTNLEVRETKHLYLRQSKMVPELKKWIASKEDVWPHLVTSIANKWLNEGLHDRGITRDLSWGVPVKHGDKWPDYDGKVFYVWFDAPIGYIGATREWGEATGNDWERWWRLSKGADDVKYFQFMGKDNVPFHTVGFPVTQMGSGEDWKLVDYIKGFNWLTYYGGKFSTSQKRGVFMNHALELLPSDYWRYYLMANAPEGSDATFTWEHFAATVNKDLADVLGNFVNRIMKFTASKFGNEVPEGGEWGPEEDQLVADLERAIKVYETEMTALEFRKALAALRSIWVAGNEYLTRAAPWAAFKSDPAQAALGCRVGLNLVHLFAHLSEPVIPTTARIMHESLLPAPELLPWPDGNLKDTLERVPAGQPFTIPDVLFQKITDDQIDEWRARFGAEE